MSTHEIITIQAGHYANFVGTHWWNMQEATFCYSEDSGSPLDISHDVLFREGLNGKNEQTFTPRLLAIDTKASLKSLKKEGCLYDDDVSEDSAKPLWPGPCQTIRKPATQKNAFLASLDTPSEENHKGIPDDLDSMINVWSDYQRVLLHPRSICLIDEYFVSGKDDYECYSHGLQAYENQATHEMIEDRLRLYVEECDYLQGFHLIADGNNGFTAVANGILQHLSEEYDKKMKIAFPLFQNHQEQTKKQILHSLYSTLNCFSYFNEMTAYFSPLSLASNLIEANSTSPVKFPLLNYKPESQYHTSAILAATLESVTAPYRLKRRQFLLNDIADTIVLYGKKVLSAGVCLPLQLAEGKLFSSAFEGMKDINSVTPVTPGFQPQSQNTLAQLAVLRGISNKYLQRYQAPHGSSDGETLFGEYLNVHSPSSVTSVCIFDEKLNVSTPFPNIFTNNSLIANKSGVAVAATLSSSNNTFDLLDELLKESKKQNIRTYVGSATEAEQDNFVEVLQNVIAVKENYGPEFSI